ncbi:MAG: SDR family oxidoreductase, partial [Dehalococcoidia bacterium]
YGRIINVASVAGKEGGGFIAQYCASKFASIGLTQSLADALMKTNITVNAVCPGIVWTQMWVHLSNAFKGVDSEMTAREYFTNVVEPNMIPQGRAQTVEDMGRQVLHYATMPNITGQSDNVDGGFSIAL